MLKGGPQRTRLVVDDPAHARILVDRAQLDFLAPFLGRECSVSRAAEEVGVDPDRMLGRVRRFVRLGLLAVARVEPRRGRAIKHYRTIADEFFVPMRLISIERDMFRSERVWHRRFVDSLERELLDHLGNHARDSGARVFRQHSGNVMIEPGARQGGSWDLTSDPAPTVLFDWHELRLTATTARQLQRDLVALLASYRDRQSADGHRYITAGLLAPRSESE